MFPILSYYIDYHCSHRECTLQFKNRPSLFKSETPEKQKPMKTIMRAVAP